MKRVGDELNKIIDKSGKLHGKIRGFTMIANRFIEKKEFSIYEKMVFIVIKKHQMNKKESWPSLEKIALQSGCSVSSVKKAIQGLQRKHIIFKDRPNIRKNNIYKINFERF